MKQNENQLKRKIGLWGLSANLVNIMIGAGIFALPAIVAAGLGSSSIFAYLFCGILITFVMLCFAEVGSRITSSGGAYTYIQTSFGPYFGFLTVILFVLAAITADAAIANAVGDIIGSIFPFFKQRAVQIILFLAVFSVLGYINIRGVKEGVTLVKLITIAKVTPLLLLVVLSWGNVSTANLALDTVPSIFELGQISLILFFAFQGAEAGLSVSGEVIRPKKTIPKAILISILGVLILYMLIQTIAQGVLGPSLSTFTENPLSEVANKVFGPIGFMLITIGAAISMFGNLSSEILSIPRVLFQASKDNTLPIKSLSKIHSKFSTPYFAIISYAALGFLFASFGGFKQLAIISSASILLVYLGVSLSVIKLRRADKTKTEIQGFKIPGGYTIPILSSLTIIWFLSNLTQNEGLGIGLFVLILSLIYFLKKKFTKP